MCNGKNRVNLMGPGRRDRIRETLFSAAVAIALAGTLVAASPAEVQAAIVDIIADPGDADVVPLWTPACAFPGPITNTTLFRTSAGSASACGGAVVYSIFPFELPPANGVLSASLTFEVRRVPLANGPDDADLAIVGIRNSPAPFLADNFVSAPPFGPIDPAMWATPETVYVEAPFLDFGVTSLGVVTTSAFGNAILTQYLQDFYAANPGYAGGSYLFLRINPTASDGTTNGNRWELYSADAHDGGFPNAVLPTLSLEVPDDADGDGIDDLSDNCPVDSNPGQEDFDEDGLGDACDGDDDDDGDPDASDCDDFNPSVFNGAIEICTDGVDNNCNGQIDEQAVGADCDADGVPNEEDNCPLDFNEFQEDQDGDGKGDVCDDDGDGDGVPNDVDNCPVDANADQADFDGDGAGDVCDADADADGLPDATQDRCLFTTTDPAAGVPSKSLGKNRWAEMDGNVQFDTNGNNPTGRMFSIYSTGGCSCAQIIEICGYGEGHTKFGCSNSVMDWWTGLYDRQGEAPFQCKDD